MSGDNSTPTKKKIVGLRTFADDVKRVRGADTSTEVQIPSKPAAPKDTSTEPIAPKTPTPSLPESDTKIIAKEKTNTSAPSQATSSGEDNLGIEFENDPEIPPFHYIRASSPEDTTFENAEEIPDKKTLQKNTVAKQKKIEQKKISPDTLNLEAEIADVNNQQQAPELGGNHNVLDVNFAEEGIDEGVIVTDQKHKRFKLFPAIWHALTGWAVDTKKDFERSQDRRANAVPKVRKSSQRKEVITRAAERTKQVPANDYAEVKERLSGVKRNTNATTEFNIKKKEEVTGYEKLIHEEQPVNFDTQSQETLAETYSYNSPIEKTSTASVHELEDMIRGNATPVYTKESFATPNTTQDDPETQNTTPPQQTNGESVPTSQREVGTGPAAVGYGSLPEYHSEHETDLTEAPTEQVTPVFSKPSSVALEMDQVTDENTNIIVEDVIERPREENTQDESGGYREYREQYGETYTPNEEVFLENLTPTPAEPESTPQLATGPIPEERTAWAQQKQRTAAVQRQAQSGTPYLTLIAIVITAILLGSGASVWWFTRDTQTTTVSQDTNTQIQSTVPLLGNSQNFLTEIKTTAASLGNDTTYITPVIGTTPATTASILDTLQISADGSFTRNISAVQFGANKNNPFIVLSVTSFDTAFGGILLWESAMPRDLTPLFASAVQTAGKDIRISNNDARVLTNEVGKEIVVYGFVDKQTILIAPSRDVFIEVLQSLR